MRGATHYAKRVKQLFRTLRTKLGRVQKPAVADPVTQLILGVLTRDCAEARAREALERLKTMVVDYNELRVVSPMELAEAVGSYPDGRLKTEDISRALNKVFAIEHIVSLERLTDMSAREQRAYLDKIDGLEPYTRARVRLLGLNQHAIPLDEAMLAFVRHHEVVDPQATHEEIQAFLERHVDAADAFEFIALLRKHAWSEMATALKKGKFEKIRSVPPDRTSRNMLQLITPASLSGEGGGDEQLDAELPDEPEAQPRKRAEKAARKSSARTDAARAKKTGRQSRPDAKKGTARKPAHKTKARTRNAG